MDGYGGEKQYLFTSVLSKEETQMWWRWQRIRECSNSDEEVNTPIPFAFVSRRKRITGLALTAIKMAPWI